MKLEPMMASKHGINGSEEKSTRGLLREEAMVGITQQRLLLLHTLMVLENRGALRQALGTELPASGVQSKPWTGEGTDKL